MKSWTWTSDFGPAGDSEKSWECPDLFQLPVDGDSDKKRWVMVVSVNWAQEQYFIGDFDGTSFKLMENHPAEPLYVDKGLDFYASRTFQDFDGTTVSECDKRIRNFLSLSYTEERKNDIITLEKESTEGSSWFILRTHNEEIDKIVGGSYKEIEEDVWLIQADSNTVAIKMKSSETQKYY